VCSPFFSSHFSVSVCLSFVCLLPMRVCVCVCVCVINVPCSPLPLCQAMLDARPGSSDKSVRFSLDPLPEPRPSLLLENKIEKKPYVRQPKKPVLSDGKHATLDVNSEFMLLSHYQEPCVHASRQRARTHTIDTTHTHTHTHTNTQRRRQGEQSVCRTSRFR